MTTKIKMGDKLYIISRADLNPGARSVQGKHALIEFVFQHPEIMKRWYEGSNYLCFLEAPDEKYLVELIKQASSERIEYSFFREPDLDNSLTSICLAPGEKTKKLCSNLRLALNDIQCKF